MSILNRQLLSSAIQAVLSAQINSRYLQIQPITTVFTNIENIGIILQKSDSKQKLQGRTPVMDIKFENLQWLLLDSVSESSADTNRGIQKGLWCIMSRDINNMQWSKEEQLLHINLFELKTVKLAILTLSKQKSLKVVHFQIDNTIIQPYVVKMRVTRNQMSLKVSKEIWQYLLNHQIIITAEYFPGSLNLEADRQSRNSRDPSEWKLSPKVFQQVCQRREIPREDLFVSSLSQLLP